MKTEFKFSKVVKVLDHSPAKDVPNNSPEPGYPSYIRVQFDGNAPVVNSLIAINDKDCEYGYTVISNSDDITTLLTRSTAIGDIQVGDTMKVVGILP